MKEKTSNVLNNIKKVSSAIISVGVGAIVSSAIANNTTKPKNPIVNVCFTIGGLCLGGLIVDKVSEYTDSMIDDTADLVTKISDRIRSETKMEDDEND